MRRVGLAASAILAVLALAGPARALDLHFHDPDPSISVIVPGIAVVLPNTPEWTFTLTSEDHDPRDGLDFSATEPPGTYYLRVFTNHDIIVKVGGGALSWGDVTFNPTYSWALVSGGGRLLNNEYSPPEQTEQAEQTDLYRSDGPAFAQINLTGFQLHVDLDDIPSFRPETPPGGTLTVTIQDALSP